MNKSKNTHEKFISNNEIKVGSERSFGLVFTAFFIILSCFALYKGNASTSLYLIVIAISMAIIAVISPALLRIPNILWYKFGLILHGIINPVILGFMFFLVITPTALFMRVMGKDPLNLTMKSDLKSYWIKRDPPGPEPETMVNQF
jgi:Saxitoxin biosynthesis operon protein SxtJ